VFFGRGASIVRWSKRLVNACDQVEGFLNVLLSTGTIGLEISQGGECVISGVRECLASWSRRATLKRVCAAPWGLPLTLRSGLIRGSGAAPCPVDRPGRI